MKIALLDSKTLGNDTDLSPLYGAGEVTSYPSTSPNEVKERIADAEVAVLNKVRMDESVLCDAKNLKLICVTATGYDCVDTEYCRRRGIALCNVPGYSTASVAQLTAAMAFSLATKLSDFTDFVSSGKYSASGVANHLSPTFREMSAMTWGIVGGGAIGSAVAKIADAVGSRVLICRKSGKDDRYPCVPLETICRESDIISLHVPLNDSTRGLIGEKEIALMKNTAIVINVSRGAITDESALAKAIEEDRIGGLGVDVYSSEPFPESHPFAKIAGRSNVCLTPHMGWGAAESRNRCVREVADNITAFFAGETRNRIV